MATPTSLSDYVRNALQDGKTPGELRASLSEAGWAETEIDSALAGWILVEGAGAVPRPLRSTYARDAGHYLFLCISLGLVIGYLTTVIFGLVNVWWPDATDSLNSRGFRSMRRAIAFLTVFAPVFVLLDRADRRLCRQDGARQFGTWRRWLTSFAMLAAMVVLLGDAANVIFNWLEGQMTQRIFAKAASVAVLSCVVLAYFGEFTRFSDKPIRVWSVWFISILVLVSIVLLLIAIDGPATASQGQ